MLVGMKKHIQTVRRLEHEMIYVAAFHQAVFDTKVFQIQRKKNMRFHASVKHLNYLT